MAVPSQDLDMMPVVTKLADFDQNSGNLLERLVFNHRLIVVAICAIATLAFGYLATTRLVLNASFEKMIPQGQPYIKNYLENKKDLSGLGNAIRVVPSEANFILALFEDAATSKAAFDALFAEGLIVREIGVYGIDNGLRISIGPEAAMRRLVEVLKQFGAPGASD